MRALLVVALLFFPSAVAFAADPSLYRIERQPSFQTVDDEACAICRCSCVKPWTIPDLWDDQTLIPDWPLWRNNGKFDAEAITDLNGDGLWNPGEPYRDGVDRNGKSGLPDGQYTSEFWDPIATGYTWTRNGGQFVVLHPGSPEDTPVSGHYYAVDLDPYGDPTGNQYEWNISHCSGDFEGPGDWHALKPGRTKEPTIRGVTALIEADPTAYYDSLTKAVVSSHPSNPRLIFLAIHDPRIPIDSGRRQVQTVKIAAFFMEAVRGNGEVIGRFVRVQAPGFPCRDDYPREAVFLFDCP